MAIGQAGERESDGRFLAGELVEVEAGGHVILVGRARRRSGVLEGDRADGLIVGRLQEHLGVQVSGGDGLV